MSGKVCAVDGCSRSVVAWGYCDTHYRQARSDPTWVRPTPLTDHQRFESHVRITPGCWFWTGQPQDNGYGRISIGSRGQAREILAHRFSYELHHGPIPDGMLVCHTCDTPLCVNPAHLFLGTHADNSDDKVRKGRQAQGQTHGSRLKPERMRRGPGVKQSKLNESLVREIRRRYAAEKVSFEALARQYGVSRPMIGYIVNRTWWRHVFD